MTQRIKRTCLDQRVDGPLVEHGDIDPIDEVLEAGKRSVLGAFRQDEFDNALADVANGRQPERDLAIDGCKVELGAVDVGHQDPNPHRAAFVQVQGGAVLVTLDRGEQRRHVLGRVVRLEPCGLVGHKPVRRRVRSVEAVAGEVLDEAEQLLGERFVVAVGETAGDELLLLLAHDGRDLLAHRLAQHVGFDHREPGHLLSNLHHLFLVHHDPVGVAQNPLEFGCGNSTSSCRSCGRRTSCASRLPAGPADTTR